jgi:two-component system CheB/CheR fusion protein
LALDYGARAACIVLSGTDGDGAVGLKSIKEKGGLVIAQQPTEAGFDGMPQSAIATNLVDHVLPVSAMLDALLKFSKLKSQTPNAEQNLPIEETEKGIPEIITLVRSRSKHDFSGYKPGTLERRIERRMGMLGIAKGDLDVYVQALRVDTNEIETLANDLLINVTSFFRDPKVFEHLSATIIHDLVAKQPPDQTLRIWSVGCSTGEEIYTLAILFREQITAQKRNVKIQFFASDADGDAVAIARDGFYPNSIENEVSSDRLERFFTKEKAGYSLSQDLRSMVIFTVQNVLADPPFSKLDMISCRNLLIYLQPEAQSKVIALFHFALRDNGILLLGNVETVRGAESQFEIVSKPDRIYRRTGKNRAGKQLFVTGFANSSPFVRSLTAATTTPRPATFAELCQRFVMANYTPATILINRKFDCLFTLGPTDEYLSLAPGMASSNILEMARDGVKSKLRSAIQTAMQENKRVALGGGQMKNGDKIKAFSIMVEPVKNEGQDLLLICFTPEAKAAVAVVDGASPKSATRILELEQELANTQTELTHAIRNLEFSAEEQRVSTEEASSVSEDYQSTNEELLTSKEELQSLNEELNALNSQLQETLERQRVDSTDLQNVLYSTDVATIFLDSNFNIRLFTPATKLLFNVLPTDIGRPLADLNSLATLPDIIGDAQTVLKTHEPMEREIEAKTGAWYVKRIMPYRASNKTVGGVVITFSDITARRNIAYALEVAERKAQLANLGKTRFLAAASHDLRQPLQTLVLLHEMLAKNVVNEKAKKLVVRLDETVGAMTGMLNALLDINQIEAGTVVTEKVTFPINELFQRLQNEFAFHAQAQNLELHVVPCSLSINTDPRLLEQMIRNLLSNALKYTKTGKVLLGCRRQKNQISIEIWDTGIGIPVTEQQAIFDEYHQLDISARERSRGLGLGLSIVKRLAELLGHRITVRSQHGHGSGFSIEVKLPPVVPPLRREILPDKKPTKPKSTKSKQLSILLVEDEVSVKELLQLLLEGEGHDVVAAADGNEALKLVASGQQNFDILLTDYNLPNGMDGLELAANLRKKLGHQLPTIVLSGNISTGLLREIAEQNCVHLNKPVKLDILMATIERMLTKKSLSPVKPTPITVPHSHPDKASIFIVDDDHLVCEALCSVFADAGYDCASFDSSESFLATYKPGREGCLLIDAYLPGMNGLELIQHLRKIGDNIPAIMITGNSDVTMAVEAMKAGASDFIEKPIGSLELIASVERALDQTKDSGKRDAWNSAAAKHIADLTPRQREIMDMVVAGHPSKNIAADLKISQRTVENHRAAVMERTGCKSIPALARLALAAAQS